MNIQAFLDIDPYSDPVFKQGFFSTFLEILDDRFFIYGILMILFANQEVCSTFEQIISSR